jgi:hypothetical protein
MPQVLKIDLHTHPIAALRQEMGIQGIKDITKDVAFEIVKSVKAVGLNGIAITEKNNFNHGWVACLQIREYFKAENLVIIPGAELEIDGCQFLQLYIPAIYRRKIPFFKDKEWFYILAPADITQPFDTTALSKEIHCDAVEEESLKGHFADSIRISKEFKRPLIRASDAYSLNDLGKFYQEL